MDQETIILGWTMVPLLLATREMTWLWGGDLVVVVLCIMKASQTRGWSGFWYLVFSCNHYPFNAAQRIVQVVGDTFVSDGGLDQFAMFGVVVGRIGRGQRTQCSRSDEQGASGPSGETEVVEVPDSRSWINSASERSAPPALDQACAQVFADEHGIERVAADYDCESHSSHADCPVDLRARRRATTHGSSTIHS